MVLPIEPFSRTPPLSVFGTPPPPPPASENPPSPGRSLSGDAGLSGSALDTKLSLDMADTETGSFVVLYLRMCHSYQHSSSAFTALTLEGREQRARTTAADDLRFTKGGTPNPNDTAPEGAKHEGREATFCICSFGIKMLPDLGAKTVTNKQGASLHAS